MVTRQEIEDARTPGGGYTQKQLAAWGVPWPPPKGWKEVLLAGGYRTPGRQRGGGSSCVERG
jgi:hypothetical protein